MEPNTYKPLSNCCCVSWKSDIATGGLECVKPSSCCAKRKWKSKLLFALRPSESISSLRNHRTSFFFYFPLIQKRLMFVFTVLFTLWSCNFSTTAPLCSFHLTEGPGRWAGWHHEACQSVQRQGRCQTTGQTRAVRATSTLQSWEIIPWMLHNKQLFFFFFLPLAGFCSSSPKSPTSPNESSASCSSQPSRSALPPSCGKWKSFKECAR